MILRIVLAALFNFYIAIGCSQPDYDRKLSSLYKKTVPFIKPKELHEKMIAGENITLLDTRSQEEFSVSHLAKAVFIDYESYRESQLLAIPKNTTIVVYCAVGYRSERVGEHLQKLGFKKVYNLYGGIFQWKNEGYAVVNSVNLPTDSVHTYNKNWSRWLIKGTKVY
jgi:rhodanese-related sulfurtransferase